MMRKTMISMILVVITAVTMIGCAAPEEATTEPTSEIAEEVVEIAAKPTEEAKSEEIEMVTGQEIIPANKPEDFEIDGRYTEVVYEDIDVAALIEAAGLKEIATDPTVIYPEITIYSFVDTEGVTQYRAYCETWDYEMNPKTEEVIYADAPIADSGALYPVILEMAILDEQEAVEATGEVVEIIITLMDEKPVVADAEPFVDNEEVTEANPSRQASATPTGKSSSPTQPPASGTSGSGNNSGGGSSASVPDPNAGKTYHEAVYEDVWVVDVPASSYEEPVYENREVSVCNTCNTVISGSTAAHAEQHMLNGEPGGHHGEMQKVQTGTKTVTVPEQGHWEKRLVREAGYY